MMFRLSSISGVALAGVCAASVFATTVAAQDASTDIGTLDKEAAEKAFPAKPPYSPYAERNFPTRPYFGDTHLHTSYSMDAGAFGARLGPKDAYRFAKGEEVIASSGQRAKLSRPLDFMVVPDHSAGSGTTRSILERVRRPPLISSPASARGKCRRDSPRRERRPIAARGAKRLRRRKKPTNLAVSLLSQAYGVSRSLGDIVHI